MQTKRILVIDDDPAVARTFKRMLDKRGGYEVHAVSDAQTGLALAKETNPSAILLDLEMPGTDGVALLNELRTSEKTSRIPVIIVTGHTKGEVIEKVGLGVIADCLTKPVDIVLLLSTLKRVLSARRTTKHT